MDDLYDLGITFFSAIVAFFETVLTFLSVGLISSLIMLWLNERVNKKKHIVNTGRDLINKEITRVWEYKTGFDINGESLQSYYNHVHISAHKLFAQFLIISDYLMYEDVLYVNYLMKTILNSPLKMLQSKISKGRIDEVDIRLNGLSSLGFMDYYQNILIRNVNLSNEDIYKNWKSNRKIFAEDSERLISNLKGDVEEKIEKLHLLLSEFKDNGYELNLDNLLKAHSVHSYLDGITYYCDDLDVLEYFHETYNHYRRIIVEIDLFNDKGNNQKVLHLQEDILQSIKALNKELSKKGNVVFNLKNKRKITKKF